MKKMLAFLLVLMVPFCAIAETYGMSFSIDTDDQLFCYFLKKELAKLSQVESTAQMDTTIGLIQRLLDGFAVEVAIQDDAAEVCIQLGGGNLLDVVLHAEDDALVLTSSLIDGCALVEDMSIAMEDEAVNVDTLAKLDWQTLLETTESTVKQWLEELQPVMTEGAFVGDAFDGGTHCKTWAVTDRDIANLVMKICSNDLREPISLVLTAMGFKADEIYAELDAVNARVSEENAYRYLLRAVSNEVGKLVGLSLTIYTESTQLATISLGLQETQIDFVLGLGLQKQNYWCECTVSRGGKDNLTMLSGKCIEWVAEKKHGFAYVQKNASPVSHKTWFCNITQTDNRFLWEARICDADAANDAYDYTLSGTMDPNTGLIECIGSIGDASSSLITMKFRCSPVEEIPTLDESLERCSVDQQPRYQEITETMRAAFMARLLKLIPLDILLQLSIPELP